MARQDNPIERFGYLWRSLGPAGLAKRILVKLLDPIYRRYEYHVANAYLDTVQLPEDQELSPDTARGRIVDSVEAFDALPDRFHPHLTPDYLRNYLGEGSRRFVLLVEYMYPDGAVEYVGYRTCEQGVFEVANARIRGPLPDNYVMIYHNEMAPPFRGRGFAGHVRAALFAHCKKIGANRITSVIAVHNVASQRAQSKRKHGDLASMPGRIGCSVWLGGLFIRKTPWDEVLRIVQTPPPTRGTEPA